jgi:hypothetical protein
VGGCSVKQNWTDASTAFQSGQISDVMAKASAAKAKLTELPAMLGMNPQHSFVCSGNTRVREARDYPGPGKIRLHFKSRWANAHVL